MSTKWKPTKRQVVKITRLIERLEAFQQDIPPCGDMASHVARAKGELMALESSLYHMLSVSKA